MSSGITSSLFNRGNNLVGVDIASTSIKMLQIERVGGGYEIAAYASASLPKGSLVNGVIEKMPIVVEALQRCITRSGIHVKNVALAMPTQAVTTRMLRYPADFSDALIHEQIEAEASMHIPFPLDEVRFDFCKLGLNKNGTDADVLLAAARREQVDGRINAVEALGLMPTLVDVESYCTQRCIAQSAKSMPKQGKGLILAHLDVGASNTTLTVVKDDEVLFQREQSFGGHQLTLDIAKQYSLSIDDAEVKKRLAELPADYPQRLLKPFLQDAAQMAARSLQFFYTSTPYSRVDQLLLAGGSSALPGMVDAITHATQVPVVLFSPLRGYAINKRVSARQLEQESAQLGVVCGLAMRAFDD
jgi:type IV pilus assembly protein PilM